jgi:hypothetical protein
MPSISAISLIDLLLPGISGRHSKYSSDMAQSYKRRSSAVRSLLIHSSRPENEIPFTFALAVFWPMWLDVLDIQPVEINVSLRRPNIRSHCIRNIIGPTGRLLKFLKGQFALHQRAGLHFWYRANGPVM